MLLTLSQSRSRLLLTDARTTAYLCKLQQALRCMMKPSWKWRVRSMSTKRRIVSACLLFFGATLAWGQSVTGTIRGTVTDASGAVVSGAEITVRGQATGVANTVKSSATGSYDVELLPVGTYRVTVSLAGFKTLQRDNVDVELGNITGLDLRLEIGDASQTVNVTAAAPILKTTEGQTTASVSTEAFADLPLSAGGGRN